MAAMPSLTSLVDQCQYARLVPAKDCYNTRSEQYILDIQHPNIHARVALQGGQLLECTLHDKTLLWLSPTAKFDGHSAIRGGIPICLPWFGVNAKNPSLPKHGFARNSEWQLTQLATHTDTVEFTLTFDSQGHETFEAPFRVSLHYRLSTQIDVELRLCNNHRDATHFSYALHSYLAVEHSERATVTGLENTPFIDSIDQRKEKIETHPVRFDAEVDRIYPQCGDSQTLLSAQTITVSSATMPTAIVWNPGKGALNVADIGEAYTKYICVERGAADVDAIELAAGQEHIAKMTIKAA